MNWLPWIIVIALALLLIERFMKEAQEGEKESGRSDYSACYQRKYLLTKNEWYAYKKLRQLTEAHDLVICPKVRLLDILEPRKREKDYKSLFWKVQAKHVDFLICDQDLHIKGVIELDDGSHDRKDRQDRDEFVDQVLQSVGYKVVRTRAVTDTTLDAFFPAPATEPTE